MWFSWGKNQNEETLVLTRPTVLCGFVCFIGGKKSHYKILFIVFFYIIFIMCFIKDCKNTLETLWY